MEMPNGTHKQTTYGWLQLLLEALAARHHRRLTAVASLEPEALRPTAPQATGLYNLAAPH